LNYLDKNLLIDLGGANCSRQCQGYIKEAIFLNDSEIREEVKP
jgi:hypothetical protein